MRPYEDLVPPWPDEAGTSASVLAFICCVVGVTVGYFLPFSTNNRRNKFGIGLVLLAMCLLVLYLYLMSQRIVSTSQPVGDSEVVRRLVVGTEVQNYADKQKSADELIRLYGLDASAWTAQSVTNDGNFRGLLGDVANLDNITSDSNSRKMIS